MGRAPPGSGSRYHSHMSSALDFCRSSGVQIRNKFPQSTILTQLRYVHRTEFSLRYFLSIQSSNPHSRRSSTHGCLRVSALPLCHYLVLCGASLRGLLTSSLNWFWSLMYVDVDSWPFRPSSISVFLGFALVLFSFG